jgi:hypothetical protein
VTPSSRLSATRVILQDFRQSLSFMVTIVTNLDVNATILVVIFVARF